MNTQLFTALAMAAALWAGGAAQAAVMTFDNPDQIEIDNTTNVATYTEAGFTISGQATSFQLIEFQPLDERLVGGVDTPFSLMQAGGGDFSLLSLDYDFFDLGFGDADSKLTITGLLGGSTVAARTVNLAGPASLMFDAAWAGVSEVVFTADAGFSLDNINTLAMPASVPEPGTLALSCLALVSVGMRRWQGRRTA